MIPDGTYTAVVDRIEDAIATLQVEGEQLHELAVAASELPPDAQAADTVLEVELRDGELVEATPQPEETERRKTEAQDRFDRLSERPPSDDEQ